MIAKLVLCVGSPSHVSDFRAYTRLINIDFPAPRSEVVLCPISDTSAIPAVVTETRIGGGRPVLVLHSDESLDSIVVEKLDSDPDWESLQPAVALKGDVLGIFLDTELTDLLAIDVWPEWKAKHTHFMISVGLVGNLPMLEVDGLDKPYMASSSPASSSPAASFPEEVTPEEMFSFFQEEAPPSSRGEWRGSPSRSSVLPQDENIVDLSVWKSSRDN